MNQNIEIDLNGQLSLAKNKVDIDKTWSTFSSLNAPYLNASLQPLFEKEEEYNDIVVDKYGNEYFIDIEGNVYKNDELLSNIGTSAFDIETLDLDCIAYNNEEEPAYIDSSYNCYFKEVIYQASVSNIIHQRVRVIDGVAYFFFLYKEGKYYYQELVTIDSEGNITTFNKLVSFGQLKNGITWETAEDPEGIQSFQVNIAKLSDNAIGFSLIGNNTANQSDKELYFFTSVFDTENKEIYTGENVDWYATSEPISKTIELGEQYKIAITQTKKRTVSKSIYAYYIPDTNKYLTNPYTTITVDGIVIPGGTEVDVPEGTDFNYGSLSTSTRSVGRSSTQQSLKYRAVYLATTTLTYTIKVERDPADYNEETKIVFASADNQPRTVVIKENAKEGTTSWKVSSTIPSSLVDDTDLISNDADITFKDESATISHNFFTVDYVDESKDRSGSLFAHTWTWTEEITPKPASVLCNMIEDNGTLRYVPKIEWNNTAAKDYIISGIVKDVTFNQGRVSINWYQNIYYENKSNNYKKYAGASYNIAQKYFSTCFSVQQEDSLKSTHHLNYNTGMGDDFILDAGASYDGTKYYEGDSIKTGYLWFNNQGAIAPLTESNETFRLLYNYGNTIQGISFGTKNDCGTVVADWASIDDTFYISATDKDVYYLDNDGKLRHISVVTLQDAKWHLKLVENRFILFNTTNYLNCYDIEKRKMRHYASDFNGRAYSGWSASVFTYFSGDGKSYGDKFAELGEETTTTVVASGQNVNYEITGDSICSALIPANILYHVVKGYESAVYCNNADVDFYYASKYTFTLSNNEIKWVDTTLKGNISATYPVTANSDVIYNVPLLSDILKTYNNRDMIKVGNNYYSLFYNNNTIVLIYNLNSMLENASDMFVIQGQYYAVINGKITAISYSGNVISGIDAIIDVNGMKFIGYLPTMAFFFSPMNKVLYSFTGDANLTKLMDCQEINEVYNTYFDTSTQSIYISADTGLYVISANTYKVDIHNISDVFFTENRDIIVKAEDGIHWLAFEKKNEDYKVVPLFLNTEFYAFDKNIDMYLTKCKLRFIKNEENNGTIKLQTVTLTDKGSETEEKVIKFTADMWDKLTDSYLVSFTPKYNKCQAVQLRVTSDFPLSSLVMEVAPSTDNVAANRRGSI